MDMLFNLGLGIAFISVVITLVTFIFLPFLAYETRNDRSSQVKISGGLLILLFYVVFTYVFYYTFYDRVLITCNEFLTDYHSVMSLLGFNFLLALGRKIIKEQKELLK